MPRTHSASWLTHVWFPLCFIVEIILGVSVLFSSSFLFKSFVERPPSSPSFFMPLQLGSWKKDRGSRRVTPWERLSLPLYGGELYNFWCEKGDVEEQKWAISVVALCLSFIIVSVWVCHPNLFGVKTVMWLHWLMTFFTWGTWERNERCTTHWDFDHLRMKLCFKVSSSWVMKRRGTPRHQK